MKSNFQIIIVFLFLQMLCSCKTFEGTYGTALNYFSYVFEFKKSGDFLVSYMGDIAGYSSLSYGKFKFKKDTLILKYSKIPAEYMLPEFQKNYTIEKTKSSGDSCNVLIKGFESKSKKPILFASYITSEANNFYKHEAGNGGILKTSFPKEILPAKLVLRYFDSEISLDLKTDYDYKIIAFLNQFKPPEYNAHSFSTIKYLKYKKEGEVYFQKIGSSNFYDLYNQNFIFSKDFKILNQN